MSAPVYLHPTAARDPAAIVRVEHATGRLAVIRPGDPAPRLVPPGAELRGGVLVDLARAWAYQPDGPGGAA